MEARAQWIDFTPCGRPSLDIEDFDIPVDTKKRFSGPAESLEVYWIWIPSIHAIVGYRQVEGDVICTSFLIAGGQYVYVLGDVNDVVDRIKKRKEVSK